MFEKLKSRFIKRSVLAAPNLDKIKIEVDELDYAIGGVHAKEVI